jgi:hypothetical protein
MSDGTLRSVDEYEVARSAQEAAYRLAERAGTSRPARWPLQ